MIVSDNSRRGRTRLRSLDGAGLVSALEAGGLLDAAALQQVALLLAVAVGPVLTQGHWLAGAGAMPPRSGGDCLVHVSSVGGDTGGGAGGAAQGNVHGGAPGG